MKKFFSLAAIACYLLTLIAFLLIGMLYAGWIGAAKNQGLAGGAIVLGYGVMFAGVALIASIFLVSYTKKKVLVYTNIVLLILSALAIGIIKYNADQRKAAREEKEQFDRKPTKPAMSISQDVEHTQPIKTSTGEELSEEPMHLGFFKPNFYEHPSLYIYGNINLDKSVMDHTPTDSITFKRLETGFEIATAPPYLMPDHMKLDYDMLYFRIKSIGRDFVELVANTSTKRTVYVDKTVGEIHFWPEFLLSVNTVQPTDKNAKAKYKPLTAADQVAIDYVHMKPFLIQGEWIQVELTDNNYKTVGKGWIKWREGGKLLLDYSLLS